MFWPEVFFLLAIFLLNFDLENMIPIYMKQYFIGGKFLPNFEKEEKFAMFPFFLKILAFAKFKKKQKIKSSQRIWTLILVW
jgi:hypothetical protein